MRTVETVDPAGFGTIEAYVGDELVAVARQNTRGWWCEDKQPPLTPAYRAMTREDALFFLDTCCKSYLGADT